jgi:thiol:disulfide interchange protein
VSVSTVAWSGYEDGLREAAASHKPVCLVFTASWCPHCRNYEKVFDDRRVIAKSQAFVMIKVDDDHAGELADKYSPDGRYVPRTLFLSADGELDPTLVSHRGRSKYVYDESDPGSLLSGMERALRKLKHSTRATE